MNEALPTGVLAGRLGGEVVVMDVFTRDEMTYLAGQMHGRLATVDAAGRPHVVPVAFRCDAALGVVDIGGPVVSATKKFRDACATGLVAFVVDDLLPPWHPRGIEVRGRAFIRPSGGTDIHDGFEPAVIRIVPLRVATWGLPTKGVRSSRSVERH